MAEVKTTDTDNVTTSEEEIRNNLRNQINELRQQLRDHSTHKDKLPKGPDYFKKYQAKLYKEKLCQKASCELCGRLQTLKHMKEHQQKPTCLKNRKVVFDDEKWFKNVLKK